MNRELIERIDRLGRYHAEHDGPFSDIVSLLQDCKAALSQEAEPVASVPQVLQDMAENSVPLGAEFERAMMNNLSSLYEGDDAPKSVPQDVEQFIVRHQTMPYQGIGGDEVVTVSDLRAWMAGHARVPVEVIDVIRNAPELNPSNYDHDQACRLNTAMCEAWSIIAASQQVGA